MSRRPIDRDAFRDFERSAFDEIAEGYRDFFSAITEFAVDPLLDAAGIRPGLRVLDVATGTGVLACRAASRGASVLGVDLAARMVQLAALACPGVKFLLADAEQLPFPDQSFDAVLCNFGIGHFPRPERGMSDLVRVVVPGGAVAVSWWDVPKRHRVNGMFFDAIAEAGASLPPDLPPIPPMFRFSDDQQLFALLQGVGLSDVSVCAFSFNYRIGSPEELWDGILGGTVLTSIGIRRQTPAVRARIRAAFDRLAQPYLAENEMRVPVAFKIGSGRR